MYGAGYWNGQMTHYQNQMTLIEEEQKEFENLNQQLAGIISQFDPYIIGLENAGKSLENVMVNGKPYDEGKLKERATELSNIKEQLIKLQTECSEKLKALEKDYITAQNNYNVALSRYNAAKSLESAGPSTTSNQPNRINLRM